jgi:site-specific DNA recombinase
VSKIAKEHLGNASAYMKIFEANRDQLSVRSISRALYVEGIPSSTGRSRWSTSMLRALLADTTYIGTTYYNKRRRVPTKASVGKYRRSRNTHRVTRDRSEWIPIPVPAIVAPEGFAKAQEARQRNQSLSPRATKEQYLLRSLMTCGQCSSTMYAI